MALFLESAGGAVVTFFHLETMAPAVSVFFHECHVDRSSGDCGGEVGSSSSLRKFLSERFDGGLCFCEFCICLLELKCEVRNRLGHVLNGGAIRLRCSG